MTGSYLQHFLYPSSLFASKEPYIVRTVLGSCVAVCLWDKKLNIGGINHYMLSNWNGRDLASPKYGDIAIEKLIDKLLSYGSNINNLQAKIFGGGHLIGDTESKDANMISERNIRVAKLLLEQYNIPIVASSTGGNRGRKIVFFTDTGEVRQKILDKS